MSSSLNQLMIGAQMQERLQSAAYAHAHDLAELRGPSRIQRLRERIAALRPAVSRRPRAARQVRAS